MIDKEFLKAGMLVKFQNQEIAIVCNCSDRKMLSWNDRSGRCLELRDYNDDLTFPENSILNIDVVYDKGGYLTPFDMDPEKRLVLWNRNKEGFSQKEKIKATEIKYLFSSLCNSEQPISIVPLKGAIVVYNDLMKLFFPNNVFFNLEKPMFLGDIIDGEIL